MQLNHQYSGQIPSSIPVVLIHGLFGKQDNLGLLKNHLIEHFPVITLDLRNHGLSEWSDDMTYELMSQDIVDLLDSLQITKAHLVGHSMGGKAAMATAMLHPSRVASLIVADIAPVTYQEHPHQRVFEALHHVNSIKPTSRKEADLLMQPYLEDAGVRQFLLKSFSTERAGWQFNLSALTEHYQTIMSWPYESLHYDGPTLFIKAGASDYLLADHQVKIQQQFPNAKAHIMAGCGHWLHAEKPAMFNQIVGRFLAK